MSACSSRSGVSGVVQEGRVISVLHGSLEVFLRLCECRESGIGL